MNLNIANACAFQPFVDWFQPLTVSIIGMYLALVSHGRCQCQRLATSACANVCHLLSGFNRAHARNAVDPETAAALKAAFEAGEDNPDVAVHILTGSDGHFCAGADLKAVSEGQRYERTGPMGPSWLSLTKPSCGKLLRVLLQRSNIA